MKYLFLTIATIIGITVLGIGVKILFFPVHTVEQLINTAYDAQTKTLNADNAIANYEWFKQQYEDIEASKLQIENALNTVTNFEKSFPDKSKWTFEDKQEYSRLISIHLGLQNYTITLIADYNAKSKMANRAIFKNSIFPEFIDSFTYLKQ